MYSLMREGDGTGDSGSMSRAIFWGDNGEPQFEENAKPRVGVKMQVGSHHARSMQYQDWWLTSFVEEILEDTENMVKFKTENSVYIWKQF